MRGTNEPFVSIVMVVRNEEKALHVEAGQPAFARLSGESIELS